MEKLKIGDGCVEAVPVLVVDDSKIWRGAVRAFLEDTEFAVVGEASSGMEALDVARHRYPEVTLLDVRMPGETGFATLATLKREQPTMRIVMLSSYDYPAFIDRAMAAGASGYVIKAEGRDALLAAMRTE